MSRIFKRISDAILKADQSTIDRWFQQIDNEIALAEKQEKVKAKILEALAKGISVQKISEITGIPLRTVYTWKKRSSKDYIKEAKELKEKMEQPQDA